MSDDKLAEALMKSRHSSTWEGPTLVCECGWEVDMLDAYDDPDFIRDFLDGQED